VLVPQLNVPGVGRVDFAVFVPQISTCEPLVIVECDGHAYHERTPDQAREDNRRDRELQRLRLPLLRFTASDVVRDDAGVAHEIALFVNEKCHEKTELRAAEAERDDLLRENYLYRLGMPVC
jgi:very-short-patch-repair endonuclease